MRSTMTTSMRLLSVANLRWVIRHRAWTPWYLVRYWRFWRVRMANPEIVLEGLVFLDRGAELYARRGYGRLIVGRWVHLGAGTALRCHEGTLRVGSDSTFGRESSVNCYLDVEIGASALFADHVYVSDFDHRLRRHQPTDPDPGHREVAGPDRSDVWLGTKVTVARGVVIGDGVVVGANSVVTSDLPDYAVAVGSPARVIKDRRG